jgi:hypothetical protein
MVVRQLEYLASTYVPYYGPPLDAGEHMTRELVDLVHQTGAQELSAEVNDVNEVGIGYLARPYVPEVQVVSRRRGPWEVNFDLPNQPGDPPYARAATPLLSAPESLNIAYADRVRAVSASTTSALTPGESVGLALAWTVEGPSPTPLTNRLVWEASLFDPSGREVGREAGLAYDWATLGPGKVVVSWFNIAVDTGATEGRYQVRVRRIDPLTRNPLAANAAAAEWPSGTVDVRRK